MCLHSYSFLYTNSAILNFGQNGSHPVFAQKPSAAPAGFSQLNLTFGKKKNDRRFKIEAKREWMK
jgi:hypothetical protein